MKRITLLSTLALFLTGCAALRAGPRTVYEIDEAEIAATERAAAQAGVRVLWVHPPTRPVRAPGS
jgi:PBP1b-binding outer membrane lipoprotein LpoB